tara:strand:+ start:31088 stop:34456 length:3369 start_codon:yes stop_codon:yes gene_type:complete
MAGPILGVAARMIAGSAAKGISRGAKGVASSMSDMFSAKTSGIQSMYGGLSSGVGKGLDFVKQMKKESEMNRRQSSRDKKANDKVTNQFLNISNQQVSQLKNINDSLKKMMKQDRELSEDRKDDDDGLIEKGIKGTAGIVGKILKFIGGTAIVGLGLSSGMLRKNLANRRTFNTSMRNLGTPQVSGADINRGKPQLVADITAHQQNLNTAKLLSDIRNTNASIAVNQRQLATAQRLAIRRVKRKRPEEMTTAEYVRSAEAQAATNLDKITEGVIKGILSDKVSDFYGGRRKVTQRQAERRGFAGQQLGEILDLGEGSSELAQKIFGKKYGRRYEREFNKLGQVYLQAFTEKTADSVFGAFGGSQQENRTLLSQVIGNYAKGNKKLAKEQVIFKMTGIPTGLESLSQSLGFGGTEGAVNFLADAGGSFIGDISKNILGVDLFGEDKTTNTSVQKIGGLESVKTVNGAALVKVVNGRDMGGSVMSALSSASGADDGLGLGNLKLATTGFGGPLDKTRQARQRVQEKERDLVQEDQLTGLKGIENTSQSNTKDIVETQQRGTFALLDGLRNLGSNIFTSISSILSRMGGGGGGGGGFTIPGMFDTGNMFLNAASQIGSAYAINYATKGIKDPALRAAAQIGGQLAFNKYVMPKIFNSSAGSSFLGSFGNFGKGFSTGIQGGSSFVGASTSYNVGVTAGKVAPYADAIIKLAQGDVKSAAFSAMGTKIGLVVSGGNPVGAVIGTVIGNFVGGLFGKEKKPKPHIRSDYAIVLEGNNNPDAAQEVFTHNRMNLYKPDMVQKVSDLSRRLTIAAFNAAKTIEATTGQASIGTHIYVMVDEITFKKMGSVQIKFLNEPNYKGERRLIQGSLASPVESKLEYGVTDRIIDKSLPYYASKVVAFVKKAYKSGRTENEQSKIEKAIQENFRNVDTEMLTTGLTANLTTGTTRLNPNLSKGIYGNTKADDNAMFKMAERLRENAPKAGATGNRMIFSLQDNKYVEAPFTTTSKSIGYGMTSTSKVYDNTAIGVDAQGNIIQNVEGAFSIKDGKYGSRATPASAIDIKDILEHTKTNPLVIDSAPVGDQSFLSPTEEPPVSVVTDNSTNTNQPVTIINNNISSYDQIRFTDTNT